jgi:hypothetical protein
MDIADLRSRLLAAMDGYRYEYVVGAVGKPRPEEKVRAHL